MAVDSAWGYAHRALTDPSSGTTDSEWGFSPVSLIEPGSDQDGQWGFTAFKLRPPHLPIVVLTDVGYRYTKVLTFDGSELR